MIETLRIPGTDLVPSRIGLGTRAIGDPSLDTTEAEVCVSTVRAAVDRGVTLIDTAPAHGLGAAEETIGKALHGGGMRDRVVLATKCGLAWQGRQLYRDASPARIRRAAVESLRRLGTGAIDIYLLQWPDPLVPIEETAQAMRALYDAGMVRAIGVCNASPVQLERFRRESPLHVVQSPLNLFERANERDVLPYARTHGLTMVAYGALCRGLLSGRMDWWTTFEDGDLRKQDPKYRQPLFADYLEAVRRLDDLARERFGRRAIHLALRWALDRPGMGAVLWGVRRPHQLDPLRHLDFTVDAAAQMEIDRILAETVADSRGPEFMTPPPRARVAA